MNTNQKEQDFEAETENFYHTIDSMIEETIAFIKDKGILQTVDSKSIKLSALITIYTAIYVKAHDQPYIKDFSYGSWNSLKRNFEIQMLEVQDVFCRKKEVNGPLKGETVYSHFVSSHWELLDRIESTFDSHASEHTYDEVFSLITGDAPARERFNDLIWFLENRAKNNIIPAFFSLF